MIERREEKFNALSMLYVKSFIYYLSELPYPKLDFLLSFHIYA
jgi:hypothetical protein